MVIYKDERQLDQKFPFCAERVILRKKDNCEDSFHYHNFCEITYVEKGTGYYHVNGVQYEMIPGDLIIFNHVEPHGWTVLEDQMQVLVITFATELVMDPSSLYGDDYLEPFIERGSNFQNKVESSDANTQVIYEMMLEILKEYQNAEMGYRYMIKADTLRILTCLIRYYQKSEGSRGSRESLSEKKKAMKRLEEAFYFINSHFREKITLEEVAGLVYMSPNYFSSYFRNVTNSTFSEYVTRLRLKKASEMVSMTDQSIAMIAMECGFRNMSNFYRLYKKHIGELPKRRRQE